MLKVERISEIEGLLWENLSINESLNGAERVAISSKKKIAGSPRSKPGFLGWKFANNFDPPTT